VTLVARKVDRAVSTTREQAALAARASRLAETSLPIPITETSDSAVNTSALLEAVVATSH
jgi:hypothetical protein